MDGWKNFPFGMANFQGRTVSFRELENQRLESKMEWMEDDFPLIGCFLGSMLIFRGITAIVGMYCIYLE